MKVKLYSYFRSSCSYRVRIALYLKNIPFTYQNVHLIREGGEQYKKEFKKISPLSQVPCLEHNNKTLFQSLPIILYLEENWEEPALLPKESFLRAEILSVCEVINSFIQPLQGLSILNHIEKNLKSDKKEWAKAWIIKGFSSLENFLKTRSQTFAFAKTLTCADVFLIPQIYNARRFEVDMNLFPILSKIEKTCLTLPAFQKALPENQPDSPKAI